MTARGLIVAGTASGSGKTTISLGLMRHLRRRGIAVSPAKAGPDYIDPGFHAAAAGRSSLNLDPWAMRTETLATLAGSLEGEIAICEGVMGLHDGGPASTMTLARRLGWPVVLILDAGGMAETARAVLRGFAEDVEGVVFNRVGGRKHVAMLTAAAEANGIPVLGALPWAAALSLPERHLGLVQAGEHGALEAFLDEAGALVGEHVDVDRILALARRVGARAATPVPLPPLGQRIAIARDAAFSFLYPHVLDGWRVAGAELAFFSPLADEAPPHADAVFLPGGYPELHAGRIAAATRFLNGLRGADRVYGECGGYMVLGEALIDAQGRRHAMAGLLPLTTSFATRHLHLAYREVTGPMGRFRGHEFHFARVLREEGAPLWTETRDIDGASLGPAGLAAGNATGSFVHLVDRSDAP